MSASVKLKKKKERKNSFNTLKIQHLSFGHEADNLLLAPHLFFQPQLVSMLALATHVVRLK